jgi:aspartate carbamoyltransferase catalytic subunit
MKLPYKDILTWSQFSKNDIELIMTTSNEMEKILSWEKSGWQLSGKVMASLFFEPSTRTRLSFESAMCRLGWSVISVSDGQTSSMSKWETIEDTSKIISVYADIMVMRHPEIWSAKRAASVTKKPFINAWDGANEHPTQSLLDIYTIFKEKWRLDNLKIAMIWDLKYWRTTHSLATILSMYENIEFVFISPDELKMPEKVTKLLKERNIKFKEIWDYKKWLEWCDIAYVTRIQKERFSDIWEYDKVKNKFIMDKSTLEFAKNDITIMHPLPRVNEVLEEIDDLQNAAYFRQAANGLPVRMALLYLLLS